MPSLPIIWAPGPKPHSEALGSVRSEPRTQTADLSVICVPCPLKGTPQVASLWSTWPIVGQVRTASSDFKTKSFRRTQRSCVPSGLCRRVGLGKAETQGPSLTFP